MLRHFDRLILLKHMIIVYESSHKIWYKIMSPQNSQLFVFYTLAY